MREIKQLVVILHLNKLTKILKFTQLFFEIPQLRQIKVYQNAPSRGTPTRCYLFTVSNAGLPFYTNSVSTMPSQPRPLLSPTPSITDTLVVLILVLMLPHRIQILYKITLKQLLMMLLQMLLTVVNVKSVVSRWKTILKYSSVVDESVKFAKVWKCCCAHPDNEIFILITIVLWIIRI